ncbi:hypothetical protein ACWEGM_22630, partial [Streptomyces nigra]
MARQDGSAGFTHRTVLGPAGRIHLVEQGTGPLVLLVHGFPESWYSWRRQLPALAAPRRSRRVGFLPEVDRPHMGPHGG